MPKPRKKDTKKVLPKLHIFCEGEKTEPLYFNGYLQKFHSTNRRLQVVKVEKTKKNTPVQLVKEAIKLKKDKTTPDQDLFWVVYDREAKSKYSDELHQQALDLAAKNSVEISLSNVCFEVWLLLHVVNTSAPYSSCNNLLKESPLKAELKKLGVNNYDKADSAIFEVISGKPQIDLARERAERMNQISLKSSPNHQPEKLHLLSPYTGVHYLLDAIDEFVTEP